MKRLFLLLAAVGLFTTACNDSDKSGVDDENGGNGGGGITAPKIELSETKKTVPCTEGEYKITVTSPCSWDAISKNDEWLIVESKTGIAGSEELEFSVEANESDKVRKGTIVVKNADLGLYTEFYVIQAAKGQDVGDVEDPDGDGNGDGNGSGNEGGNGGDNTGEDVGGGTGNEGGSGDDNTGGDHPVTNEKKLVKMSAEFDGESETTTYSYDNQGRLIQAIYESRYYKEGDPENGGDWGRSTRTSISRHTSLLSRLLNHRRRSTSSTRSGTRSWETYTHTTQYEWSDSTIKVTEQDSDYTSSSTFTLNNGLVQSCSVVSEYSTITENYYYSDGRLVRAENSHVSSHYTDNDTRYYTWDGDKLTSTKWDGESDRISLTYNGTCKKGYNPLIGWYAGIYDDDLGLAHPGICGVRTNQLLATVLDTYNTGDGTETVEAAFSYELNKEGYISTVTMVDDEGFSVVYTLTWK